MEAQSTVNDFMREFEDFDREINEENQPVAIQTDYQTLFNYESSYLRNDQQLKDFVDKIDQNRFSDTEDPMNSISFALKASDKLQRSITNLSLRIREIYISVFPEVLELTQDPVKLSYIILRLKDFSNLDSIDFSDLLDKKKAFALIMALQGKNLSSLTEQAKSELLNSCKLVADIDEVLYKILDFLQSKLIRLMPNVVAVTGDRLAARLLIKAGNLQTLAKIPACNIQVMGASEKGLAGLSKNGKNLHLGLFKDLEIVKNTDPKHQTKLVKFLASGVSKASKIDMSGAKKDGSLGVSILNDVKKKFELHINPKKGEFKKPLPAPDSKPKIRRGGKKFRKMKERLGLTDVRQMKNRLNFGTDVAEDIGTGEKDMGSLAQQSSGRLKVNIMKQQTNLNQKQKKRLNLNVNKGSIDGLKSTIALSHTQAIELVNPVSNKLHIGVNSVFGDMGFKSVIEQRSKNR